VVALRPAPNRAPAAHDRPSGRNGRGLR
jgi:hypothetical protein